MLQIKKAAREAANLLISLAGPSGSGKTLSAIQIARGLVGPDQAIGFLDTESGRANMYSDVAGGFDVAELDAPFTPERYVEAIRMFEKAGYRVLVIDSASHEWEGEGGVLDMADAGGKKGLQKWAKPKLSHKKFMRALTTSRMHIIVCLRTKEKLRQVGQDIVSDGLIGIQEKNFIYEMTVSAMLDNGTGREGVPTLTKCPSFLRDAFPEGARIDEATGQRVIAAMGQKQIDDELEDLKQTGNDKAFEGTDELKAWFEGLSKEQKLKIRPSMENLKSIAAEADSASASPAADDVPDNPFASGDAA